MRSRSRKPLDSLRVIFAGTPGFAARSLAGLVAAGVRPVAVLTQPDRPAGRGKRLTPGAVKRYSEAQDLPILQPATLRDPETVETLAALTPDIVVVAAYGLLLPQAVLDVPSAGCLNVHASLLPRWRGAAPIQAAILAGDETTGVCLMSMTAGLDCGPVYASESTAIRGAETGGELHDRLAAMGASLLVEHLAAIVAGDLEAVPQDDALATYAPKIRSADAELDWQRPADELLRSVCAYNPVPGAWFVLDGERIKCWRAESEDSASGTPGQVLAAGADGVVVACGAGALRLVSLQRPGRKTVTGGEFAGQFDLAGRQL